MKTQWAFPGSQAHEAQKVQLVYQLGHKGAVRCLNINAKGTKLASGGDDSLVKIWDVNSGKLLGNLGGTQGAVRANAFSPDGELLISGGSEKTLRVWRVSDYEPLYAFGEHKKAVIQLSFIDPKSVFSASIDGTICFWDLDSQKLVRAVQIPLADCTSFVVSPRGDMCAVGTKKGTVGLVDVNTGSRYRELIHVGKLKSFFGGVNIPIVRFDREGTMLLTVGADSSVKLWEVKSSTEIRSWRLSQGISACAFSENLVAFADEDNSVRLFDVTRSEGAPGEGNSVGHTWRVHCLAFWNGTKRLASGSDDGRIFLWDTASLKQPSSELADAERFHARCVALNSKDGLFAQGMQDGHVHLWNLATGKMAGSFSDHASEKMKETFGGRQTPVDKLAFSRDGRILTSWNIAGVIIAWDVKTGKVVFDQMGAQLITTYHSLALNNDGTLLAAAVGDPGGSGERVVIWDTAANQITTTLPYAGTVLDSSMNADGSVLACATYTGASVYDTKMAQLTKGFGSESKVQRVALSANGEYLAHSTGETLKIYKLSGQTEPTCFQGHSHPITSIAFRDDNSILASADLNGVVVAWDLESKKALGKCDGHDDSVEAVGFSPNGKALYVAGRRSISFVSVRDGDIALLGTLQFVGKSEWITFASDGELERNGQGDIKHLHWCKGQSVYEFSQLEKQFRKVGVLRKLVDSH